MSRKLRSVPPWAASIPAQALRRVSEWFSHSNCCLNCGRECSSIDPMCGSCRAENEHFSEAEFISEYGKTLAEAREECRKNHHLREEPFCTLCGTNLYH